MRCCERDAVREMLGERECVWEREQTVVTLAKDK